LGQRIVTAECGPTNYKDEATKAQCPFFKDPSIAKGFIKNYNLILGLPTSMIKSDAERKEMSEDELISMRSHQRTYVEQNPSAQKLAEEEFEMLIGPTQPDSLVIKYGDVIWNIVGNYWKANPRYVDVPRVLEFVESLQVDADKEKEKSEDTGATTKAKGMERNVGGENSAFGQYSMGNIPRWGQQNQEGHTLRKGLDISAATTEELRKADEVTKAHRYSKRTQENYDGHIRRAKDYISQLHDEELKIALDTITKNTVDAMLMFVVYKCETQNTKFATADNIQSAFKYYFQKEFNCQNSPFVFDSKTGEWEGNPTNDIRFVNYIKSLKSREGKVGVHRQSLAMSYNNMERLMTYLKSSEAIEDHGEGTCLYFQAFAATAFTLWTRNDELISLKGSNLQTGLNTSIGTKYFKVTLAFRNTHHSDIAKANVYEVHPQPNEPHTCSFTKLNNWLQWLDNNGYPLQADDYVFPALNKRGTLPKVKVKTSHSRIGNLLDVMTAKAGIITASEENSSVLNQEGRYTPHCFRRGGAQYRFMFAGEKWSLEVVKWWGRWSEHERNGTIIRYLLDEFTNYEPGYSDMLSPTRSNERHVSFMDESLSSDPEVVMRSSLIKSQEGLRNDINQLTSMQQLLITNVQQIVTRIPDIQAQPSSTSASASTLPSQRQVQVSSKSQSRTRITEKSPVPRIPDIDNWKQAINQWNHGDPGKGLHYPLSLWTSAMRQTDPTRYSQRKSIFEEYRLLSYSDDNMLSVHGDKLGKIGTLITSIRKKKQERKTISSKA
ncbi:hypothetical protein BGZ76_008512, partial [Entomortierella beljakovae]